MLNAFAKPVCLSILATLFLPLLVSAQIQDARYSDQPYSFKSTTIKKSAFVSKENTPIIDLKAIEMAASCVLMALQLSIFLRYSINGTVNGYYRVAIRHRNYPGAMTDVNYTLD